MTVSNVSTAGLQWDLTQGVTIASAQSSGPTSASSKSDSVQLTRSSETQSSESEITGYTVAEQAQIAAYEKRMESNTDPKVMLYTKVLTDSDKKLLSSLNGGNWQNNGPANLLVDQIAAARQDGSLTGSLTTSFIQNIVAKQAASDAINPDQVEIPQSVLNQAVEWIQTNSKQIGSQTAA